MFNLPDTVAVGDLSGLFHGLRCKNNRPGLGRGIAQGGREGRTRIRPGILAGVFSRRRFMRKREIMPGLQRRVEAGNFTALKMLGQCHLNGQNGVPRNVVKRIELWQKATGLGSVEAHYELAIPYCEGDVVQKDKEKVLSRHKAAAIGGDFASRHDLGRFEYREGRTDRALQHWTISAKMGHENSSKCILELHQINSWCLGCLL